MSNLDNIQHSEKTIDNKKNYCTDFHGAAVIIKNGQEIEITDEMVDQAINELINNTDETDYKPK